MYGGAVFSWPSLQTQEEPTRFPGIRPTEALFYPSVRRQFILVIGGTFTPKSATFSGRGRLSSYNGSLMVPSHLHCRQVRGKFGRVCTSRWYTSGKLLCREHKQCTYFRQRLWSAHPEASIYTNRLKKRREDFLSISCPGGIRCFPGRHRLFSTPRICHETVHEKFSSLEVFSLHQHSEEVFVGEDIHGRSGSLLPEYICHGAEPHSPIIQHAFELYGYLLSQEGEGPGLSGEIQRLYFSIRVARFFWRAALLLCTNQKKGVIQIPKL